MTRYVPGRTLEDVVTQDGPLTGPALLRLARGLASALTAVHAAGVVHRDLKPANVMLVEGEPVVIDFGIAQAPDSTRLTMTGMFMGTPGYLAPEVIEGSPSGPAADVHSWAATLAFAATGRPPFGTGSFEAIFYRIVNGQPDLAAMPAPLLPMVLHALARDPARRPSAAELADRVGRAWTRPRCVPDLAPTIPPGRRPGSACAPADLAGAATGGPRTAPPGSWPGWRAARPRPRAAAVRAGAAGPAARGGLVQRDQARSPAQAGPDNFADLLPPVQTSRSMPPGPAPALPGAAGPAAGSPVPAGRPGQAASRSGQPGRDGRGRCRRPGRARPGRCWCWPSSPRWSRSACCCRWRGPRRSWLLLALLRSADVTSTWLAGRRRVGRQGASAADADRVPGLPAVRRRCARC